MSMLYESEAYVVVHEDANAGRLPDARNCYIIVDKPRNVQVALADTWAQVFEMQLNLWQRNLPSVEEVDATLESYCVLAQNPLVIH